MAWLSNTELSIVVILLVEAYHTMRSFLGLNTRRTGEIGANIHDRARGWPCVGSDRARQGKPGSEIQARMAIVVFFGLLMSTCFEHGRAGSLLPILRVIVGQDSSVWCSHDLFHQISLANC